MKYNLSKIMLKAWKIYRKTKGISFGESASGNLFTEHGYLQRLRKSTQRESRQRNRRRASQRKLILLQSGKNWGTR